MRTILLSFEPGVLSAEQLAQVQAAAPDMRLLVTRDRDEVEAALDEIEIAAVGFPRDLLPKARNLRWFQQWVAGADWLLKHPFMETVTCLMTN